MAKIIKKWPKGWGENGKTWRRTSSSVSPTTTSGTIIEAVKLVAASVKEAAGDVGEVGAGGAHLVHHEEEGEGEEEVGKRLDKVFELILRQKKLWYIVLQVEEKYVHLVEVDAQLVAVVDQLPLLVRQQVRAAHLGQMMSDRAGEGAAALVEGRLPVSDQDSSLKTLPCVSLLASLYGVFV